ncbi:MAG: CCA tRNA nucleotidyltransferase [Sulfurimonas sp.]|nr:CCA tRNA nucleotidyltransferase [Sulfurimonas sp.]
MIDYPKQFDKIFDKLDKSNAKIIIVGGFVRDSLLKIDSKDVDIEVYGISSFKQLENILQEFGDVNIVGKSFGVCKLQFAGFDLDFSLPRSDNKTGSGHRGFEVEVNPNLDFKTAASRRDFTINAIGYDVKEKKLLDPFNGLKDLKNKRLKYINKNSFREDPLRVLRAVQFCARFNLKMNPDLYSTCRDMVKENQLNELTSERIFEEIKKLLLKSSKPSVGLKLLQDLDIKLFKIDDDKLKNIDDFIRFKTTNDDTNLTIMLALLYKDTDYNIEKLTNSKSLDRNINKLLHVAKFFENKTDKILYAIAKDIDLNILALFLTALDVKKVAVDKIDSIVPVIHGKDLLDLGIEPSKEYSQILQSIYEAQLRGEKTIYLPILELSISITV